MGTGRKSGRGLFLQSKKKRKKKKSSSSSCCEKGSACPSASNLRVSSGHRYIQRDKDSLFFQLTLTCSSTHKKSLQAIMKVSHCADAQD